MLFQASTAELMRSSLFWDVTQRREIITDVSGQLITPIFKGRTVQEYCLTVEDGTDNLSRDVGN